mmetsp:Transcript_29159/g.68703  ORF Transcript_29159/g.68703 Transcript_29159/m.68703 type:complete len:128 (+) Transcript_29159:324-707(+)
MFLESKVVTKVDDDCEVVYRATKSPVFVVSNRDVCLVKLTVKEEDGTIISAGCSVTDPACPEAKGFVRMTCKIVACIIRPSADGASCRMTYVNHSDPNGSVPTSLVKTGQTKAALTVDQIRQALAKQ